MTGVSTATALDGRAATDQAVTLGGGRLIRNALIVAGSSAGAQGILLLGMPVLSRLYGPRDFGAFGAYTAIATALITIACLRYEAAIPLPREDGDGLRLLVLALGAAFVTSMAVLAAVPLLQHVVLGGTDSAALAGWLWLLPVTVFAGALYQALSYWCVRVSAFKTIAKTKLTQGVSGLVFLVGLGLMGASAAGLLIGDLLSRSAGSLQAARVALATRGGSSPLSFAWPEMKRVAVTYRKFPQLASVSSLVNVLGLVLAPPLFVFFYGMESAGSLVLAQRVVGAPVLILSGAVSQVYFGEAVRRSREDGGDARGLFLFSARRLALLSAAVLVGGFVFAPWLFPFVFGGRWEEAGQFAQILSISAAAGLLVSPLSQIVYIAERQAVQLAGDVIRLVLCVSAIVLAVHYWADPRVGVAAYTAAMFLAYAGFFVFYYRTACGMGGSKLETS
jgi:O-antigen/teichoic acid export membrane protein